MGNYRLYKIEWLHMLDTSESEWLKVTALNLFRPTVSPPFSKGRSFDIATQPQRGEKGNLHLPNFLAISLSLAAPKGSPNISQTSAIPKWASGLNGLIWIDSAKASLAA